MIDASYWNQTHKIVVPLDFTVESHAHFCKANVVYPIRGLRVQTQKIFPYLFLFLHVDVFGVCSRIVFKCWFIKISWSVTVQSNRIALGSTKIWRLTCVWGIFRFPYRSCTSKLSLLLWCPTNFVGSKENKTTEFEKDNRCQRFRLYHATDSIPYIHLICMFSVRV